MYLYGRAIDPSVTVEQIEAAVQTLQELDPPKARLDGLARPFFGPRHGDRRLSDPDLLRGSRAPIVTRKNRKPAQPENRLYGSTLLDIGAIVGDLRRLGLGTSGTVGRALVRRR